MERCSGGLLVIGTKLLFAQHCTSYCKGVVYWQGRLGEARCEDCHYGLVLDYFLLAALT